MSRYDGIRWFRKPWFKILTFILFLPLWAGIVLTDRYERKSVKIFALVLVVLSLVFSAFNTNQPRQSVKIDKVAWQTATQTERLNMIDETYGDGMFQMFRGLKGSTTNKIEQALGKPYKSVDNVWEYRPLTNGVAKSSLILTFRESGRLEMVSWRTLAP